MWFTKKSRLPSKIILIYLFTEPLNYILRYNSQFSNSFSSKGVGEPPKYTFALLSCHNIPANLFGDPFWARHNNISTRPLDRRILLQLHLNKCDYDFSNSFSIFAYNLDLKYPYETYHPEKNQKGITINEDAVVCRDETTKLPTYGGNKKGEVQSPTSQQ